MAILTTTQSRWFLSLLVLVLSAIAIGMSGGNSGSGERMFTGRPGDIRGMGFIMGIASLGVLGICRIVHVLLPRPWRLYSDRLEFTLVAILWICWTSATMSFSVFTLGEGVCSTSPLQITLPTCPLLTFDLALLHLLSTSTLALLLVILSISLSPGYAASLSTFQANKVVGRGDNDGDGDGDVLIMWELAVNSPPPSPRLAPLVIGSSGYGAIDTAASSSVSTHGDTPIHRKDRFAQGRVISYVLLLLVSISVVISAGILMAMGESVTSSVFMIIIGSLSTTFSATFLYIHRRNTSKVSDPRKPLLRVLEVGSAISLFLLWPLAAISFTLFPSIPNRACDNPASSVVPPEPGKELDTFTQENPVCILSFTIISLAWLGAWIVFARLLGIVFPLPDMIKPKPITGGRGQGEGTSLLRPQVKYGRLVAGEAFELGDDD